MTNKERMLHMVLDDKKLQELYDYDETEYEDMYAAMNSENIVVASVARILKELVIDEEGSTTEANKKKVYSTVFNYINENLIL